MIGPTGILTMLVVAATSPGQTDYTWVGDEAAPVQPTNYHENVSIGIVLASGAQSADQPTLPAGTGRTSNRDYPTMQAGLQDVNPFQDEEPAPIPPPDQDGQPLLPMPPDPGGQQGTSSPLAPLPSSEMEPDAGLLGDDIGYGDYREADRCHGSDCGECGGRGCDACRAWPCGIRFDGWISQGFTINTDSPRNRSNFPVTFNDRSNDYQVNQVYVLLERPVPQRGSRWEVGGRVDLLYGSDAKFTTARGLETYGDLSPKWNTGRNGLALPQCYMEVYAPWGNGLTMKLGHFYTILGHESVPAVDNFFYSHCYAMQYGEPFTHTGLLGSTRLGSLNIQAGITRGWDNWEDNNNDVAFLAGLGWTSSDRRTAIGYAVHVGREQDEPPSNTNNRTTFSLTMQHQISNRVQYVAQYDHGFEEQATASGRDADWFGLNQYLFYQINAAWRAGLRYEWFRDEDATRVHPDYGGDYFAVSAGLNWTPNHRVTVRPELRWDWVDTPGYHPFGDGRRHDQILLDCDVIVRF